MGIIYAVDFGFFIGCFSVVVWSVVLDLTYKEKLTIPTIVDVVIVSICLVGVVYEAIIASDIV